MSAIFGQKSESSNMKSGGSSGQELSMIISPSKCHKVDYMIYQRIP
jgi:hypothetical protein